MAMLTVHILNPDGGAKSLCGLFMQGINPLRPSVLPDNCITLDESRIDNLFGTLPDGARICMRCYQYGEV